MDVIFCMVQMFQILTKSINFLNSQKISFKVQKQSGMLKILNKLLSSKKDNQKNTKNKIFLKGKKILELSFKEVSYYLEK